jgi:hypothetical protein
MFPCTWEVEVPFLVDDAAINEYKTPKSNAELYLFRWAIINLYADYCDGRCEAYYEFENTNDL